MGLNVILLLVEVDLFLVELGFFTELITLTFEGFCFFFLPRSGFFVSWPALALTGKVFLLKFFVSTELEKHVQSFK